MDAQPKRIHTGCGDVACLAAMAKTLTLKNLPEELHARLSAAAKRHRRSLNQEAILCLETGLAVNVPTVEEELVRIRALRDSLGAHSFDPEEIDAFKREGRP
jgi:antitoxin FitA